MISMIIGDIQRMYHNPNLLDRSTSQIATIFIHKQAH